MIYPAVLVAVGDDYSKKSEKFENGNWSEIQEPPIDGSSMSRYAPIFHGGSLFYFGGWDGSVKLTSILRLSVSSWTWSNVGQLKSSRRAHEVILVGNTFTIVGGNGNGSITKYNEACLLNNEQFTCTELSSSLTNYFYRPILYLVSDNYQNC